MKLYGLVFAGEAQLSNSMENRFSNEKELRRRWRKRAWIAIEIFSQIES